MSHDPTRTSVNTHLGGSNLEFRAPVKEGREKEREREREREREEKEEEEEKECLSKSSRI